MSPNLSFDQLYVLAVRHGIPAGLPAQTAAAIAIRESGGRPDIVGDIDNPAKGCQSLGLWQINSCPARDKSGIRSVANRPTLLTPDGNAEAMAQISNHGKNWGPWTTYRKGIPSYELRPIPPDLSAVPVWTGGKASLSDGLSFSLNNKGAIASATAHAAADAAGLGGVLDFFTFLSSAHNWYRVAIVGGGLALAVVGLVILNRDTISTGVKAAATAAI